ncbi:MAG: hypothetical protein JXR94_02260 [Candidatus Hydrogenedentes bacterium]|nr:hypothetical protein [Candidatus Hydrogenedentota bacterium]
MMKNVYRITLWHGNGKGSTWDSDTVPKVEGNGIMRFKCRDGLLHWITGTIEITEYEQEG